MDCPDSDSATSPFAPMLALVTVAYLLAHLLPAQAGELCSTGVAGTATSCEAASELAASLSRARVDRTLATDPLGDRGRQLDNTVAPQSDIVPLFAMTADGDNTNFQTSLTQWGSALSIADQQTLKQAQAEVGGDLTLPKSVKRRPDFDIWTQGRRELFVDNANNMEGNAFTSYLGADYRWHHDLLIGGMVQLDDSRRSVLLSPDAGEGTALMVGPYMAYRVTPNIRLDAKAAWGTAHDSAISGADSVSLETNRTLTEAKLTGNWGWNAWQLSQSGAVTYIDETSGGGAGLPPATVDITRFSLGPELKRHFDTGYGASIEPFAFFKSSLDFPDTPSGAPLAQNTIGGGVTLAKPDKYNISAVADVTESTVDGNHIATGKVLVKVPSRLLGF